MKDLCLSSKIHMNGRFIFGISILKDISFESVKHLSAMNAQSYETTVYIQIICHSVSMQQYQGYGNNVIMTMFAERFCKQSSLLQTMNAEKWQIIFQ